MQMMGTFLTTNIARRMKVVTTISTRAMKVVIARRMNRAPRMGGMQGSLAGRSSIVSPRGWRR